LESKLT
jgi:hypothetical protein